MLTAARRRVSARRQSPARRVGAVLAHAVPVLVAAVLARPQLLGLSDVTGFLHISAFPAVRGLAWLAVALALAVVTAVVRRRYPVWLLVVAVLAAALDLGAVAVRGTGDPLPPPRPGDVTAVTINTLYETSTPRQVGELVVEEDAAVVAMPETSRAFADDVAAYTRARGVDMQVFGGGPSTVGWGSVTSLLVRTDLGAYEQVPHASRTLDAVVARPERGDGPTVAAVHSPPPLVTLRTPRAWEDIWRDGAGRAAAMCRDGAADLVLGDLNATLDHEPLADLGGCVDAAASSGAGAEGTWPASLPTALAAPIDHVFVSRSSWQVRGTDARIVGGSDHRALLARLHPRG